MSDRAHVEGRKRCPGPDNKIIFTKNEANLQLVGCLLKAEEGNERRREKRIYECEHCDGWHLTAVEEWVPGEKFRGSSRS